MLGGLLILTSACGLAMSTDDRLARAETAFAAEDYSAAAIDAKNVLRDEPDNARARLLLARASMKLDDSASAESEFRRALDLGVPMEDVAVELANTMLAQGRFQDVLDTDYAMDKLNEADQIRIQIAHGAAYLGLDQSLKARQTYTDILAKSPEDVDALLGVASSYASEQNLVQARATLEHVQEVHPDDSRVWIFSGILNQRTANFDAARDDFSRALALAEASSDDQEKYRALIGLTETHLNLNNREEARKTVDALAELDDGSLAAKMLLARVAFIEKDLNEAQGHLQDVLSVSDYYPAKVLLGAVQLEKGNYAQAEELLASAVAQSPNDVRARQQLAQARLRMRRFNEAQEALAPLTTGSGADARSLSLAAVASLDQGRYDEAIDFLKRGIAGDPNNSELQFQLVASLLAANRLTEADKLIEKLASDDSDDAEYRLAVLKVLSLFRAGNLRAAQASAKGVVASWPDRSGARSLLGRVLQAAGDVAGAHENFSAAVELDPSNEYALRLLAAAEEQAGEYEAASSRYDEMLGLDAASDIAMLGQARVAYKSGDKAAARIWLEKAFAANPGNGAVGMALAGLYFELRDLGQAEAVVKQSLDANSDNAELHNMLGAIEFERKQYELASSAFEKAAALAVNSSEYRINQAMAEALSGNTVTALRMLDAEGDAVLDRSRAGVMLASLKAGVGEFDEALKVARELQSRYPAMSVAIALEAEIYALQGDLAAAGSAYDRALGVEPNRANVLGKYRVQRRTSSADAAATLEGYLRANPDDAQIRLILADALGASDNVRAAIREYERVVALQPKNGVALNNLAWSYYLVQDPRAEETARLAYENLGNSGSVADTFGWILAQNGKLDEAVAILAKAALMSPNNGEIRYHYGYVLAKMKRTTLAREELTTALEKELSQTSRDEVERLLASLQ
jgi:putative PEP-CTERM system TPR-repeat lipoprotein